MKPGLARPDVALGLVVALVGVAYWPGLASPSEPIKLALLGVALPGLLAIRGLAIRVWPLWLALAWGIAGAWWAPSLPQWTKEVWLLVLLCLSAELGTQLDDFTPVWLGLGAALAANLGLQALSMAGLGAWMEVAPPAGTFVNRNMLGELAAMGLVGCLLARLWPWALVAGLVLALSQCRGAMVGVYCGLLAWIWPRSRTAFAVLVLFPVNVLVWVHFSDHLDPSSAVRLAMWLDLGQNLTLTGSGLGSFYQNYPLFNHLTDTLNSRPIHAHNDLLELGYELGIFGAILALALAWRVRHSPLCATLAGIAVFGFPLHQPATLLVGGLCIGAALRPRPDLGGGQYVGRVAIRSDSAPA